MAKLERETQKLAVKGVTPQQARQVLVVLHGHPTK